MKEKKKASLPGVKISSLAVDERSGCRQAEEWKWGEQGSRWCLVPNVLSQRSAQLGWNLETITHTDVYYMCACKLFYSLIEKHWDLNTAPPSPVIKKLTLWTLRDFDAFIKDPLLFEFFSAVSCDVNETSYVLWILMAWWAVCVISDETPLNACVVLGWLVGAAPLWRFALLWKLAKPARYQQPQKPSLSTRLCSS